MTTASLIGAVFLSLFGMNRILSAAEVQVVKGPDISGENRHYVANRPPLAPSPFVKLPIGSIQPAGWLRHMLETERAGMIGRLQEISPWLDMEKSAWGNREGRGSFGWEEMPYWLKGYGDLGYVLRDDAIIAETKKWIESAIASQREDGWFGPRDLLTSLDGKPDLWPHMVMLNVLQSYHEFSGDPRVIDVMTRYMKWQNGLPVSAFGEGFWPKIRAGDNIESVIWLYNRTGEAWLLELARKIHEGMARWDTDVINWHNVNLAQGFRAGTVAWMVTRDPAHLESAERNYTKLLGLYGQFPGGGFVGDENCREGFVDPRGGIETCGIVEFMHSFQMLVKITGHPIWVDRCEEIAFNSFPASMPPDQKGLHYITCANQIQLDRHNKSPGIQNGGTMFSYSPFEVYRCCQHNVSHGWPYYAEELWLATPGNGLCASLYAPSEVTAQVGDGTTVTIREETDYPFGETVTFQLTLPRSRHLPAPPAGTALVRRRIGRDQQRDLGDEGPAALLLAALPPVARRRYGDTQTADARRGPPMGAEPGCGLGRPRPAELLPGHHGAVGIVRQPPSRLARMGGLRRIAVELRPRARCARSGPFLPSRPEARSDPRAAVHTRHYAGASHGAGPQDPELADGPPEYGGQAPTEPGPHRRTGRASDAHPHGGRPPAHHGFPPRHDGTGGSRVDRTAATEAITLQGHRIPLQRLGHGRGAGRRPGTGWFQRSECSAHDMVAPPGDTGMGTVRLCPAAQGFFRGRVLVR